MSLEDAARKAMEFCEFAWRDVPMNEYAFDRLEQTMEALRAALAEAAKAEAERERWEEYAKQYGHIPEAMEQAPNLHPPRRELSDEHMRALRESHQYTCEEAYFAARPQMESKDRRNVYAAAFQYGWMSAIAVLRAAGSSDEDRRDAERFRWMNEHVMAVDMAADPDNLIRIWHDLDAATCPSGRTLREAVDKAMRAAGGEG